MTRTRRVVVVDNSALAKRVGQRIRRARESAGLTQAQVAGDRYTAAYISALERGLAKPSLASMAFLSERLRVAIADLIADEVAPQTDGLGGEERVRIHEQLQQASGLIRQAQDELPLDDPAKEELHELAERVWEIGYELLGSVRYEPVDELAKIIEELDAEEPFLAGEIDSEEISVVVTPWGVAARLLDRLHGVR